MDGVITTLLNHFVTVRWKSHTQSWYLDNGKTTDVFSGVFQDIPSLCYIIRYYLHYVLRCLDHIFWIQPSLTIPRSIDIAS